jgi:hypothetical protein
VDTIIKLIAVHAGTDVDTAMELEFGIRQFKYTAQIKPHKNEQERESSRFHLRPLPLTGDPSVGWPITELKYPIPADHR